MSGQWAEGGVLVDHEHVFVLLAADVYDNFWTVFNNLISVATVKIATLLKVYDFTKFRLRLN